MVVAFATPGAGFKRLAIDAQEAVWPSDISWEQHSHIRSGVVLVGPQTAERWLRANIKNRRRNATKEMHYASALERREFMLNGEPVIFSRTGRLIDGQTRLHAIVASGMSVYLLVVWGVDDDAQDTIDSGVLRSPGDVLALHDVPNANDVAAALSQLHCWRERGFLGQTGGAQHPTKSQLMALLAQHPEVVDLAAWGHRLRPLMVSRGLTIAIAHILSAIDPDASAEFLASIESGAGLVAGDPRLTLRETLLRDRNQRDARSQMSAKRRAALVFRSWNAWRSGDRLTRLQWTEGDAFPVPA